MFKTLTLGDKKRLRQKRPRLKLSVEEYNLLRRRVLERDGWRCQDCGSSKNLHIHHLVKRSKLGDDVEGNLVTLCASCHSKQHGRV
jgi:5-methylcytosine-specific restriction endonuclease McrA